MAANVYRQTIIYNAAGQFATNTFYWRFEDGGYTTTQQAAAALLNAWNTAYTNLLKLCLSTHVTIIGMKARRVSAAGGFEAVKNFVTPVAGTRTGNLMAAGTGPVIIGYPISNGKQRARTFLPGVSVDDCFDGVLTDTFRGQVNIEFGTINDDLVLAGTGTPTATNGIWHPGPPAVFTPLLAARCSDVVGTQRRRQQPV